MKKTILLTILLVFVAVYLKIYVDQNTINSYILLYFTPVIIIFYFRKRRNLKAEELIFHLLFIIYVMYIIHYTLFPMYILIEWRYIDILHKVNFTLFHKMRFFVPRIFMLNILLTIPLGFGIKFIFNKIKHSQIILLSLLIGPTIEITQLSLSLIIKYPYRIIDINDVIANGLGVLIGYYVLFKLFSLIYTSLYKKNNFRLLNYIYEVCSYR